MPHKSRRCSRPHHHNHLEKQVFDSGSKLALGYSWDKKAQKSCSLRKDKSKKKWEMALCAPALGNFHFIVCFVKKKAPLALRACGAKRRKKQKKTVILEYQSGHRLWYSLGTHFASDISPGYWESSRESAREVLGKYPGSTRGVFGKY